MTLYLAPYYNDAMEHPLIGDISNLTVDQVSSKISELHNKLNIATRSGNGHLCNQIRMAIESYQTQYRNLLEAERKDSNVNFDDKIDIK